MKHLKKLIALFLAMVIATSFTITALAAETEPEIPENATCHTIELNLAADGTVESYTQDGITPRIWNQINHTVSGNKTYTLQFTVPERYFAYEMRATTATGGTVNANYNVELLLADFFAGAAVLAGLCTTAFFTAGAAVLGIDLPLTEFLFSAATSFLI